MGEALKRNQTFHETLIPALVEGLGMGSYLEFGTHQNQTIGNVKCERRYGVDTQAAECEGAAMFKMTTQEFITKYAAQCAPFDFVFIDADHRKAEVAKDFFGILPFVSDEGIIALHDTNPETLADTGDGLCSNAWELVQYITGDWEAVTLPYHPGLTLVRKRTHWGPIS